MAPGCPGAAIGPIPSPRARAAEFFRMWLAKALNLAWHDALPIDTNLMYSADCPSSNLDMQASSYRRLRITRLYLDFD